jgi:hypothetical protein
MVRRRFLDSIDLELAIEALQSTKTEMRGLANKKNLNELVVQLHMIL